MHRRDRTGLRTLTAACLVMVVFGMGRPQEAGAQGPTPADGIEAFLANHWREPLPPQGTPPKAFTAPEASLSPEACRQCHPSQWEEWRTSLHSHAMGAGIQWQLATMNAAQTGVCLRCHAPLAEQRELALGARSAPLPAYISPGLDKQGLVCAACHVRGHVRFGPSPRTRSREPRAHGGFRATDAFADSRFCAPCHQFPENGFRLAGKLPEDTVTQWRESGRAHDQSCQSCHMPERRHWFRGIHDPEMVRKALDVQVALLPEGEQVVARVTARNVGAGHHFPTYMVAKVALALELHSGERTSLLNTRVLGWQADLDLERETFDTRIPAGGADSYTVRFPKPAATEWHVELSVKVAPREHYERLFRDRLANGGHLDPATQALLRTALREAEAARFEALRLRVEKPER